MNDLGVLEASKICEITAVKIIEVADPDLNTPTDE